MSETHIMIDIETLGTKPGCAVLSICAIPFDLLSGEPIGPELVVEIKQSSCREFGLTIDQSTVEFWKSLPQKAQDLLDRTAENGGLADVFLTSTIPEALNELTQALDLMCPDIKERVIWANSPTFDLSILEHLYDLVGQSYPWLFYRQADCRTAVLMGRLIGVDPKNTLDFKGVPHDAYFDTLHQIKYVSYICRAIKGGKDGEGDNNG